MHDCPDISIETDKFRIYNYDRRRKIAAIKFLRSLMKAIGKSEYATLRICKDAIEELENGREILILAVPKDMHSILHLAAEASGVATRERVSQSPIIF